MQKIFQPLKFVLFLCLFNAAFIAAQDQRSGISYQALILNTSEVELPGANQKDSPLRNKEICLQFSLIDETGNYEYIEHVRTTTDSQGMVNLVIGTGTPVGGSQWSDIEWSAAMKSLKVDFDITGQCNAFEALSLQQLTAVPFALYAPGAGTEGPQGEEGPSAYDTWVALGNTGDEQRFIDSLKGDQGDGLDLDWPDGTTLGDTLTWIWNGTEWVGTITNTDNNTIIITSSAGSNAQVVCEDAAIDQITYAINIDPTGLTVSGLPNGVEYNIVGNIVYITGTIDIDVASQTTFNYTLTVPNGTINIVAQGTIIVSPKASLEVVSGELNQNSCIGEPITPITFQIDGPAPNATVTGLPPGVEAILSGNTLTISGTATGSIASGSIYSFLVETSSLSCENVSISGALTLTDCSSCYPSVNAGTDNTICAGESYVIENSSAANYTTLVWTTSGTGTFNDTIQYGSDLFSYQRRL